MLNITDRNLFALRLVNGRVQEVYLPNAAFALPSELSTRFGQDLYGAYWHSGALLEEAWKFVRDLGGEEVKGMLAEINALTYQWANCHGGIKKIEDHSENVTRKVVNGDILYTAWKDRRYIPLLCASTWIHEYAEKWHGVSHGRKWWGNLKARLTEWHCFSSVSVQSKGKVPTAWLLDIPRMLHVARCLYSRLKELISQGHPVTIPRHDYWMLRQLYQCFSSDMTWGEHGEYDDIPLICLSLKDAMNYRKVKAQRGFAKGFGVVAQPKVSKETGEVMHQEAIDSYEKEVALLEEWKAVGTATKDLKERASKLFFERDAIAGPKPPLNYMTLGLAAGDYTEYSHAVATPYNYVGIYADPAQSVFSDNPILHEAEELAMEWAGHQPGDLLLTRTRRFLAGLQEQHSDFPSVKMLQTFVERCNT